MCRGYLRQEAGENLQARYETINIFSVLPVSSPDSFQVVLDKLDGAMYSAPGPVRLQLETLLRETQARGDSQQEAAVQCVLGACAFSQGDYPAAGRYTAQALALAREHHLLGVASRCLNTLGLVARSAGQTAQAMDHYLGSLRLAQELHDELARCRVLGNIAALHMYLGNAEQAYAIHSELLLQVRRLGHLAFTANTLIWLAREREVYQDPQRALAYAREALELSLKCELKKFECQARMLVGQLLLKQGELAQAGEVLRPGVELARQLNHRDALTELLLSLGQLQLAQGDTDEAGVTLQEALHNCAGEPAFSFHERIRALATLSQVAEQQGNLEQALKRLREQRALELELHSRDMQLRTEALSLQVRLEEVQHRAEKEQQRSMELAEANLALRQTEAEWRYRATHDLLTGLMNRSWLHERLAQLLTSRRDDEQLGLILINLDDFRMVNDRYGHFSGDQVLMVAAQRLLMSASDHDLVGRVSGDEFVVLARHLSGAADLEARASQLLQVLRAPYVVGPYQIEQGASLVTLLAPWDGEQAGELMQNANLAMTQVKRGPGNRVLRYTPALSTAEAERRRLERELREAVEGSGLSLHYQPQFQLPSRQLTGYEALVRWNNPRLGPVSPASFIPIAEETGVIVELGYWVLREACRQAAAWKFAGRCLSMAVNVSVRQFEQPDFVERVVQALHGVGLPGSQLVLELTESLVLHDKDLANRHIMALRAHGIRIAIDDFGTGYSSLSLLRQLPFEQLKIDRSFIQDFAGETQAISFQEARVVMEGVTAIARGLGLHVTAEGVETEEQLQLLSDLGCDKVQGFLLGRPVPAAEAEVWLPEIGGPEAQGPGASAGPDAG